MIELLGVPIQEPDVVFTDLGLALLAAYLAARLWATTGRGTLRGHGAALMGGLAGAALCGAVFHAFFPAGTATRPGFLAWIPVALSIVVAASVMLDLALRLLVPARHRARRTAVLGYALGFAAVVLLADESFASIVRLYVPALALLLVAAGRQAARSRRGAWVLVAGGLALSAIAALLQQIGVALHPVYFDHNAVYHLVQAGALVILYHGFRRVPEGSARAHAIRPDPAPRAG